MTKTALPQTDLYNTIYAWIVYERGHRSVDGVRVYYDGDKRQITIAQTVTPAPNGLLPVTSFHEMAIDVYEAFKLAHAARNLMPVGEAAATMARLPDKLEASGKVSQSYVIEWSEL